MQDALLPATGAGGVAGHERVVAGPHHEVVLERGLLRLLRVLRVVQPQVLLRRIRQQVQEVDGGRMPRGERLGLVHHLQGLVIAALGDALAAALAQIGHEDREQAAGPGRLALQVGEHRVGSRVRDGQRVEDAEQVAPGGVTDAVEGRKARPHEVRERRRALRLDLLQHRGAHGGVELGYRGQQRLAIARVADVALDRGREHRAEVLRGVGQRRIRAGRDAVHALRAVLGDEDGGLPPGHELGGRGAGPRGQHAGCRVDRGGLVIAEAGPELAVEALAPEHGRTLLGRRRGHVHAGERTVTPGHARLGSHRRPVRRVHGAVLDLAHAPEPLEHHLHVRRHDRRAEAAELLPVLLLDLLHEVVVPDPELLQEAGHLEERPEEGVALHAQLQVGPVGRATGDGKAGQDVDPNPAVQDRLSVLRRDPRPGLGRRLVGLPDERAPLFQAVDRIGVRERLRVAAQHHADVPEVAVHPDALRGDDEEVLRRGALLLRSVLRVGAHVHELVQPAELVARVLPLRHVLAEGPDDLAEVLAGRDHAPAADRVEPYRDGALGQQRRPLGCLDLVGVIDADDEEARAIGLRPAVLPRQRAGGKRVGAEDALRPEVARTEAIDPGEDPRHLGSRERGHAVRPRLAVRLEGPGEGRAQVPAQRVVPGERLVGALEHDDVPLAGERAHQRHLGEGTKHVYVHGADPRPPSAQEVHGGLDVLGGRPDRHEHGLGVIHLVTRDEAVATPRQRGELLVRPLEKPLHRLVERRAVGDDAVHVVLLVLHGPEEHRVGEIDQARHATAGRAEQGPLGVSRALDEVVGRAQELANQRGLVHEERALEVRRQEAVLGVDAGHQRELRHAADDQRLVRSLLRVLRKQHDPARVEHRVDVVVAAVHVQRVLGQRPRRHFQHHRRELAGRVIELLGPVDDALAGREVDGALATGRKRNRPALRGVLPFCFDGELRAAEDVQPALGKGQLEVLAHLRRGRDRVEHAAVGDARLGVVGHELVAVGGDPDSGVWHARHGGPFAPGGLAGWIVRLLPRCGKIEVGYAAWRQALPDEGGLSVRCRLRFWPQSAAATVSSASRSPRAAWPVPS